MKAHTTLRFVCQSDKLQVFTICTMINVENVKNRIMKDDRQMKFTKIIVQVAALYMFNMIGTWIGEALHLPIPGSLIGMFLLLVLLGLKVLPVKWFELGAETLVALMPFLLIPPTIGLMNYGSFFMNKGISLFITVVASTFLIIIVAGHTGQYLANRKEKETQ